MSDLPTGFESAKQHARGMQQGSNMKISASLVVDMCDLIEQQQKRIAELEEKLDIQTKRGDLASPAMDTACDFKELYDGVCAKNKELAATVERLRDMAYQKDADMAIKYGIDGSNCKRIAAWIDDFVGQQNLNAVKREVLDVLINYGCELRHQRWVTNPMNGVERPTLEEAMKQEFVISRSDIERYKNSKYPSGKDGE